MPKKRKTREEKVRTGYRLENFKLREEETRERKDVGEFAYLSKQYVVKDLARTVLYSLVILGLLFLAKQYWS